MGSYIGIEIFKKSELGKVYELIVVSVKCFYINLATAKILAPAEEVTKGSLISVAICFMNKLNRLNIFSLSENVLQ